MDNSLISAVAAIAGAAILAIGSWLIHQREVRAQWFTKDVLRRGDLYNEFIEESSKCYLHALQHHEPDLSLLVVLYAKINRMRVLASPGVLATAEDVVRGIINTYSETDVTFTDINLRTMVQNGSLDLLRDFSDACRAEADLLRARHHQRLRAKWSTASVASV